MTIPVWLDHACHSCVTPPPQSACSSRAGRAEGSVGFPGHERTRYRCAARPRTASRRSGGAAPAGGLPARRLRPVAGLHPAPLLAPLGAGALRGSAARHALLLENRWNTATTDDREKPKDPPQTLRPARAPAVRDQGGSHVPRHLRQEPDPEARPRPGHPTRGRARRDAGLVRVTAGQAIVLLAAHSAGTLGPGPSRTVHPLAPAETARAAGTVSSPRASTTPTTGRSERSGREGSAPHS
jgi:hypothetical protein